uniref:RNase III domain-containing protein n=1 Tax=Kwoniella bestiolae CBS 10118 TaxID=1296100 RepID=A0A1B9FW25_9TREE|nr:hypothetical protein I302_07318 [Kwoniella bestiolae CBS 10118]OCF22968.1 hypothetical protein I302_07318 [Kwoniella bestiolae CBS 10118]
MLSALPLLGVRGTRPTVACRLPLPTSASSRVFQPHIQSLQSHGCLSTKATLDKKAARRARKAARKAAVAGPILIANPSFTFSSENLPPLPVIKDEHLAAASLDNTSVAFQQLALLGDALFRIAAIKSLWNSCSSNGTLSHGCQSLTTNKAFSQIAKAYDIQNGLKGYGSNPSIASEKTLGSALEARMGAAYLDAYIHGKERESLRWGAQVLDMNRWDGMKEYIETAEEKVRKPRLYSIPAKGDIWASGQSAVNLAPAKVDDQILFRKKAQVSTESIISRIFNFIAFSPYNQPVKSKVNPPITLSILLRRRRLSQEQMSPVLSVSPTCRETKQPEQPVSDAPPNDISTLNGWNSCPIPLKEHALPLLLPITSKSEELLGHLSDKDSIAYQQKGRFHLYKLIRQALSVYQHTKANVGYLTGILISTKVLSHLARHYGFDSKPDGSQHTQTEAARRFARYFAMLLKDRKVQNSGESLESWIAKVCSKEVWPTLDKSSMPKPSAPISKVPSKAVSSSAPSASAPPSPSTVQPITPIQPQCHPENVMKVLAEFDQRLLRIEKSLASSALSPAAVSRPSKLSQAKEAADIEYLKPAAKSANIPASLDPTPRSWRPVGSPKAWSKPIIQVNLSRLPPLPDGLRSAYYNKMKVESHDPHLAIVEGFNELKAKMSTIARGYCQHEVTLDYVLKHHTAFAVTSHLAKFYDLTPIWLSEDHPQADEQQHHSNTFLALFNTLVGNSSDPKSQHWLSEFLSPEVWVSIKTLAKSFDKTVSMQEKDTGI